MKETIIIIVFISVIVLFFTMHRSEVKHVLSTVDNDYYLVRNDQHKQKAADTLATIKKEMKRLVFYIDEKCKKNKDKEMLDNKKYVDTIINRIDDVDFKESGHNSRFTSYSVNKGEEVVFCLRSKINGDFHDMNEIYYVAIHEIAHIGCPEVGHTKLFEHINLYLLKQAQDLGLYMYKDYDSYPLEYCGISLSSNILNGTGVNSHI